MWGLDVHRFAHTTGMSVFDGVIVKTGLFNWLRLGIFKDPPVIVKVDTPLPPDVTMKHSRHSKSDPPDIDLHALDAVLDAFAEATQNASSDRTELYEDFHRRMTACTQSLASAVFSKRKDSQFTMVSHTGWRELDAKSLAAVKEGIKQRYLNQSKSNPGQPVATYVGKTQLVNGIEYLYVLVRPAESDPLIVNVFEDLVREIARQIESYEVRRSADQQPKALQDLAHLVQLAQNIGKSKTLTQTAMHLVNDLAKTTGADRVCFFEPSGKLLAVSGVSQVSLRTSLAKNLSRIARIAKSTSQAIESTDDQLVFGDVRRVKLVQRLVEELDSEIIYISPLIDDGQCCGMVALEYFDPSGLDKPWNDQRNLISQSLDFITPVVSRSFQVQSIPGIRVLDLLFNRLLTRPARVLLWAGALGAILLASGYFLFLVQRPFEIHAEGTLQPVVQRNVFAPHDGEIRELFVTEGTRVNQGDRLVQIESKSLQEQMILVEGELAEVSQELQNLEFADLQAELGGRDDPRSPDQQTRNASEVKRLKARQTTLENRKDLLQQQLDRLLVLAPIDGQVTTQEVDRRLESRPINRGDLLMSISAMHDQWELELKVPDNRVEFIRSVHHPVVRFRMAADSEQIYRGELREFEFRSRPQSEQDAAYVTAFVDFHEKDLDAELRFGSRVIAKIDCGQRSNFFLLTYELNNKFREWFFY